NACNGAETCQNNHCVPGSPLQCDDGNPCTTDCNPQTGCSHQPVADDTPCDDGNACTRPDTCQNGHCSAGPVRDCDDGNTCTTDSCDQASGCKHASLADGTSCQDGNACTTGDACIHGACVSGTAVDCNDPNPCTVDS